jgi:hypothetical protein
MTLKTQWYRDKLAKKSRRGFCGYPVATVAFYGPDDTRATKVSVAVVAHDGADAGPIEPWFCLTCWGVLRHLSGEIFSGNLRGCGGVGHQLGSPPVISPLHRSRLLQNGHGGQLSPSG